MIVRCCFHTLKIYKRNSENLQRFLFQNNSFRRSYYYPGNSLLLINNNKRFNNNSIFRYITSSSPSENDSKPSIFQRFKTVYKKYWFIVLPVHLITSAVWFGSFYFISSSGVDVPALLDMIGIPEWITDKVKNGNTFTGHLLIAYGLYKIFTPLRYMVTLGGTGITVRYLQKIGYMEKKIKK